MSSVRSQILSEPMIQEMREHWQEWAEEAGLFDAQNESDYLSVENASKRFDIPKDTLRKWLKQGRLTKHKILGCVRIKVSELEANKVE